MKRVVIDTNVVVSALLFGGAPGNLIPLWNGGRIRPLCSKGIIEEYLRVLAYPKFRLTEKEIDFILSREILHWFEVVAVQGGRRFVNKDSEDDKFIWCAVEGKAEAIVSGDDHLLKLKGSSVPVLSISAFLKTIPMT